MLQAAGLHGRVVAAVLAALIAVPRHTAAEEPPAAVMTPPEAPAPGPSREPPPVLLPERPPDEVLARIHSNQPITLYRMLPQEGQRRLLVRANIQDDELLLPRLDPYKVSAPGMPDGSFSLPPLRHVQIDISAGSLAKRRGGRALMGIGGIIAAGGMGLLMYSAMIAFFGSILGGRPDNAYWGMLGGAVGISVLGVACIAPGVVLFKNSRTWTAVTPLN